MRIEHCELLPPMKAGPFRSSGESLYLVSRGRDALKSRIIVSEAERNSEAPTHFCQIGGCEGEAGRAIAEWGDRKPCADKAINSLG